MVKVFLIPLIIAVPLFSGCSNNRIDKQKGNKSSFHTDSLFFQNNYRMTKKTGLPKMIDVNSLYIESYYLFGPNRIKYKRNDEDVLFILRFYESGGVNDFSRPFTKKFITDDFNPEKTGRRGICFYEDNHWYIDIYAKSSELNTMGIYRYKIIEMTTDTLKLKWEKKGENTIYVYSKNEIKNDSVLNFKANW